MKAIFFDLEGPLTPQDNAFELMKSFPQGGRIFEAISHYDDLLALEAEAGYEPGTTLSLIIPFLLLHHVTEAHIRRLGEEATLTPGAAQTVAKLSGAGWAVFAISTSYQPFAAEIVRRVGILPHHLASTPVLLEEFRSSLDKASYAMAARLEQDILRLPRGDDEALRQRLDTFFQQEMSGTPLGAAVEQVKPVGGRRKVAALGRFASPLGLTLGQAVAVGDSITDCRMLESVARSGGLAVAFNANSFALPCANLGLASRSLTDLLVVTKAWELGGKEGVEGLIRVKESLGDPHEGVSFHWLEGRTDLAAIVEIHQEMRHRLRKDAAGLG